MHIKAFFKTCVKQDLHARCCLGETDVKVKESCWQSTTLQAINTTFLFNIDKINAQIGRDHSAS